VCVPGVWTHGFMLAKQLLTHTSRAFVLFILEIDLWQPLPELASNLSPPNLSFPSN
jgi:hypothetical protein